ncbi:apolipoprotein N-acyltransferase [Noviherbaspirillum galbum]|uniref:Apolipoprotein N-acyltransferase n=1 Tax=Noviherbaspirillum galbum TaxID=2709383 RepID=A0A6B3SPA4_9BURK|nr:apolipoprotein N-acyltransferase [Noviherbaspirillum galbum]NEX61125.1 apolipoprotein N-acyltransferase [Noviherbaspirillum galbum]
MRALQAFPASIIFAALAGAISAAGWAPSGVWIAALAGAGCLYLLVGRAASARRCLATGIAFGTGLHLAGSLQIIHAALGKTGAGGVMAAGATALLIAGLAAFTALPCLAWHASGGPGRGGAARFAALLTLGEAMRLLVFNGHTSLSLGYALVDTWLAGVAPVTGLYGLSFAGFFTAAAGAGLLAGRPKHAVLLVFAAAGWLSGLGLGLVPWSSPSGAPLQYRLLQTRAAQAGKFDPDASRRNALHLAARIESRAADLIVTPETAFAALLSNLPGEAVARMRRFSDRSGSHVLLGAFTPAANGDGYNSLVHLAPRQTAMERHDKASLMPFGEYSPAGFGWLTHALDIPFNDLASGGNVQPAFIVRGQRVGTLICHEDQLGSSARRWIPEANLLVNPTNLAWLEGSAGPEQGLQIARMRALEAGRPILRVANAGITAHIDEKGHVIARLPEGAETELRGMVQPVSGATPFARAGNLPVLLFCLGLVGLLISRRSKHDSPELRKD